MLIKLFVDSPFKLVTFWSIPALNQTLFCMEIGQVSLQPHLHPEIIMLQLLWITLFTLVLVLERIETKGIVRWDNFPCVFYTFWCTSECKFLKTIPLSSLCKLQKQESVKMVNACSVYMRLFFLYKVTLPTSCLAVQYSIFCHFQIHVNGDRFDNFCHLYR